MMMGKTHKVIAASTAAMLNLPFLFWIGAWLLATLPDIDFRYGHRKFTHSFLSLGIFSLISFMVWEPLGICLLIGCGTHIVADSFTKMGVPAFYPYKKMLGMKTISTGSDWDWMIFYMCLGILLLKWL